MLDYSIFTNEEEQLPGQGIVLKKARAKVQSPGGVLSTTVRPEGTVLPNSIERYRQRAGELYEEGSKLYDAEPDMSQLQAFAKQRGQQGEAATLNALAAQFAGEQFQPLQAQFLKRAAAAQDPMKVGSGMITADGQFIKDPEVGQTKKAEFLMRQAQMYENMAQSAQSAKERLAAQQAQNEITNQLRLMGVGIQQMNAQTARMNAGGGGLGVGSAVQIGSGAGNEPIFRGNSGQLFTYDQAGQPVVYAGPVNPKASSATPTEDERKAAGWFFQADNARRNMEQVVKRNPGAAYPSVPERMAGFIPGVGGDVANTLRPEDRQKFVQASESMAEALLRAATGAGVNKDEAAQKVRELVPQLGDKPGTVEQKSASYDVYMKSLQARAGRALPAGAAPSADNDPLGIRRGR